MKKKNGKYITLLAQVRELFIVYLGFSLCHTFLCKCKNIAE